MATTATPVSPSRRVAAAACRRRYGGPAITSGRAASSIDRQTAARSAGAGGAVPASGSTADSPAVTTDSSTSTGKATCTGPGRPDAAHRHARAKSPAIRSGSVQVQDALQTFAASPAWSISWNAPAPGRPDGDAPESSTSGDSAHCATYRADSVLANPGPAVTIATPGRPLSRPMASAACTAAASWRTWISSSGTSIAASNSDMIWLPESVKTCRVPLATMARTSASAVLIERWFAGASIAADDRADHRLLVQALEVRAAVVVDQLREHAALVGGLVAGREVAPHR